MCTILLPIKPEYAKKIVNKTKIYEYRKSKCKKNVDKIVKRATKNLKEGNIILMHDTHKRTIDAVKKIVPIIKEKGFKCITVSDYKTVSKLREQNG